MKITLSLLLIVFVLILTSTKLYSQPFNKNMNKSLFVMDAKAKSNILPEKIALATSHESRNFLSEFKSTRYSQAKKFSNIPSRPRLNFGTGDLKGKTNILPAKSDGSKFTRKRSWSYPRNEVKTKAWKI